jgi:hypothetical protein
MTKYFFLGVVLSWGVLQSYSQSVAINTDGSMPDPHAIVDIKSSTKGVLIPRLNRAARLAIPNTRGLLVYDTNDSLFWYNSGTGWRSFFTADQFKKNSGAWVLSGNSGTRDRIDFLGTTDNIPLNFRVNNQPAGRIDASTEDTYFGYQAGKRDTIRTIGTQNSAFGCQALELNTTGSWNTAIGVQALGANKSGSGNTANGFYAMLFNLTGNFNTTNGAYALERNAVGDFNVANGAFSLSENTTGTQNTADGTFSLNGNMTGYNNTAAGFQALNGNLTGYSNVAVGMNALFLNTSGNNLTAIGTDAGAAADGLNNATAIGAGAIVNAPNKVRIGDTYVTVIEGQVPFTTPSDGRFKFNVRENVKGLDFILKLRPVTYQFDVKKQADFTSGKIKPGQLDAYISQVVNDEATQMIRTGFIAQEVEQAAKKTGYEFDAVSVPKTEKEYYSLSYSSFVVPLVKALQEQQEIIQTQNQRIASLEQQLSNNADKKKTDEQNSRLYNLEKELAEIKKLLLDKN